MSKNVYIFGKTENMENLVKMYKKTRLIFSKT